MARRREEGLREDGRATRPATCRRRPATTRRRRPRGDDAADVEGLAEALLELQQLTERLRRDCPWDREQTARTIVPHTVEEAYEVADAALADDDEKLLDELGDLLFQVYFLSLLLEERGKGDLASGRAAIHAKLVRRHPHVFGEVEAETAGARAGELGADQARAGGPRGRLPRRARGAARRCSTRARCSSARRRSASSTRTLDGRARRSRRRAARAEGRPRFAERRAEELGDVLFAAVNVARKLDVDPELELRRASERFRAARRGRRASSRARTAKIGASCRSSSRTATSTAPRRRPNEPQIADVHARQILDSRGNPTVEVDVLLESGASAARPCPRARRPACTRRSSCATAARRTAARA